MITCPICNKKVKNYYSGNVIDIAEDEDFECPTRPIYINGASYYHYYRYTVYAPKEIYTIATIPPFQFTWINDKTIVKLIKISEDSPALYSDLITLPAIPITHDAINELGSRLTKLIYFI